MGSMSTVGAAVLAVEGGNVSSSVVSSLTSIAGDITSTINAIAPIALGIVGIFLAWKYGTKFFKSISK